MYPLKKIENNANLNLRLFLTKSHNFNKTFQDLPSHSKMTSYSPSTTMIDDIPPPPILVRTITCIRWWAAAVFLDENPHLDQIEASPSRLGWSWYLQRTPDKFVYIQNTYLNGNLMVSSTFNTDIDGREKFIKNNFPLYIYTTD